MAAHVFKDCSCGDCPTCDWDCTECLRCGAVEGEIPSECPGHKLHKDTKDRIFSSELDFKCGRWIDPKTGEESSEQLN